jgi:hypothetical protein
MAAPPISNWATNANYSAGDGVGTPAKVAPSYELADGFRTGDASPPDAQPLNYTLNLLWAWVSYFFSGEHVEFTTAAISTAQHNYTAAGFPNALVVRFNLTANSIFTGFAAATTRKLKLFVNSSAFTATVMHENILSTAANRNFSADAGDIALHANEAAFGAYDSSTQRWRFYRIGATGGGGSVTFESVAEALSEATHAVGFNGQGLEGVGYLKADPAGELILYKGADARLASSTVHTIIKPSAGGLVYLRDAANVDRIRLGAGGVSVAGNEVLDGGTPTALTSLARLQDVLGLLTTLPALDVGTSNAAGASSKGARDDHAHALPETTFRAVANACTAKVSFNSQGVAVSFVEAGGGIMPSAGAFRMANASQMYSVKTDGTTPVALLQLDGGNAAIIGADNAVATSLRGTLVQLRAGGIVVVQMSSSITAIANTLDLANNYTLMTPRTELSVPTPSTGRYIVFLASDAGGVPSTFRMRKKDDTGTVSDA